MIPKLIEPVFLGAIAIALATSCGFMCKTDILWPVPAGAMADAAMQSNSVVLTPGVDYSESAATGGGIVTGELKEWHKVEISFSGPSTDESASSPNPFLDYRLDVFFTSPSNMVSEVPGFYAGDGKGGGRGDVWMVRFSPDEPGEWAYAARFRTGVNVAVASHPVAGSPASFDGASGTFEVAPLDPSAEGFLKWGRLEYVGEHYLKFRDGGHFIKSGINSPETFLSYVGFDNTPRAKLSYSAHKDDWDDGDPVFNSNGSDEGKGIIGAINYLSSVGVNSVYFLPMNIGGDGQDVAPYVSVNLWSGGNGASDNSGNDNLHFDISKLDQWSTLFEHAQKKGVMLHVVLSEAEAPNKRELDNAVLGRERKLYYRELVARFGYLLALQWNLCEEYDLGLNLGVTKVSEWGNWLHALDPYKHPVTVHNANKDLDAVYRPFLGQPWLGTTSVQDTGIDPGSVVEDLRTWSRAAGRPVAVSLDEMFQQCVGSGAAVDALRKQQMYPIYLSGGAGLELHVGGLDLTLQNFRQSVNGQSLDALWRQLAVARRFVVENLPFWEMEPDDGLLTGERGTGHVFAKPFAVYAVYLPEGGSANLDLSLVFGSFRQRWFNPRTGAFEGPAMTVAAGHNVSLGTPPASPAEDWIVLLEATDPGNKARVLYPVADLYFEDGVKKAGEPVMKVQYDNPERIAVIKFDASEARPPVQSATLFLRCVVDGGQPRLRFYKALNPDFTEESISTVPAYGGQVASSDEAFAPNSGYYAFDVSDAIDGAGDIAFVIKGANPSPGSDAWFATTEDGSNSPRLHIVDSSVPDPTPTATPTVTPSSRTVTSRFFWMTPTIDADLSEWSGVPPVWLDASTADFVDPREVPGLADASVVLRSGWDEQFLYFAIEVSDDALVADSEDIWRDDSVELGIDGLYDHIGWGSDDHRFTLNLDGRVTDFGLPTDVVTAVTRTVSGGWVLEVALAAEGLGAGPLTEGKVMGFTSGLRDDDDGGDWDSYLIWEGDSTNDSSAEYGGLLLGPAPPTPTATSTPIPTATPTPTPTAMLTPTPTSTPRTVNSYYLPMLPVALQIDGEINEWDAVPAVVLDIGTADHVHERGAPDPADASAILRSGWDDGFLYFAIEVHDDALVTDSEDTWRDDSIELGIDGLYDHIGWASDDHQFTFNLDGRITDFGWPTDVVAAVTRTVSGGWTLEVAIEAGGLHAGSLEPGKAMGFTFGLHDDDDGGDWDSYLIWEGDRTNNSSAEYGALVLKLPPATLGGLVWNDADADGTQDATEAGLSGVALSLRRGEDSVVSSTTTDADGSYSFDDLSPGTYTVVAIRPSGYRLTTPGAVVRELEAGEEDPAARFGFVATTAVALVSFQAHLQPEGVVITWSTFGERGITGFQLQRALSQSGPWLDVTDEPVPARGMIGLVSSYQVVDADVESGFTYYYRLVTTPGMQEFGPISVSVLQIQWEPGLGIQ